MTFRIKDPDLLGILKLDYDMCELTGETGDFHLHHVLLRSQGGDDVRENIVNMLGSLHERYHRGDAKVREMLAWYVWQERHDVVRYLNKKLGADGFDIWFRAHTLH